MATLGNKTTTIQISGGNFVEFGQNFAELDQIFAELGQNFVLRLGPNTLKNL